MYAAEQGGVEAVRKLLDAGANTDDPRHDSLPLAIAQGHVDAVHALLSDGGRLPPVRVRRRHVQRSRQSLEDPAKIAGAPRFLSSELWHQEARGATGDPVRGRHRDIVEAVQLVIDEGLDELTHTVPQGDFNQDDRPDFFSSCSLAVAVVLFPCLDRAKIRSVSARRRRRTSRAG